MKKLASAGAIVLTVLFSFYFCCAMDAPTRVPDCCEKQCARTSAPTDFSPPAHIGGLKPAAPLGIARYDVELSMLVVVVASPHLFDPITTIQLRI